MERLLPDLHSCCTYVGLEAGQETFRGEHPFRDDFLGAGAAPRRSGLDDSFGCRARIARVGSADPHLDRHRECGGLDPGPRARSRIRLIANASRLNRTVATISKLVFP